MTAGKTGNPAIFALSSAAGRAGVAVIRISGSGTAAVIEAMTGRLPRPRMAALRDIRDPASPEILDRGLLLWFPAPRSFTGEDVAELHVHGSRAVLAAIFDALHRCGLRIAEAGEFTMRAFENGKIDLTEAEGLADLIAAETAAQRRQALAQAAGVLRHRFEDWRDRLIQAMALVEASLDFSDEAGVVAEAFALALPIVTSLENELQAALDAGRGGEVVREGVRVAIVGAPNVGKSSLLNAIAGRDAAIVFDEPGTTRDVIEVTVDIGGFPFVLSDTAGLRETESAVEREGIRRSLATADSADLVIEVRDASQPPASVLPSMPWVRMPKSTSIVVLNKIDVKSVVESAGELQISAKTGSGLDKLRAALALFASSNYGGREAAAITRSRHRQEIEAAHAALIRFREGAAAGYPIELLAEDLRNAATATGRLTGAVDADEVLGAIFSEFCIGK